MQVQRFRDRQPHMETVVYYPEGAESRECPAVAITPASWQLVELFTEARLTRKETGANILAPLIREDARMADAAAVIQCCRIAQEAAMREAVNG